MRRVEASRKEPHHCLAFASGQTKGVKMEIREGRNAWVASLKVGDKVIFSGSRGNRSVRTVDEKKNGCPTVGGVRFNRAGTYSAGTYSHYSIHKYNEEAATEIRRRVRREKLIDKIKNLPFEKLTDEHLEQMNQVVTFLDRKSEVPAVENHPPSDAPRPEWTRLSGDDSKGDLE